MHDKDLMSYGVLKVWLRVVRVGVYVAAISATITRHAAAGKGCLFSSNCVTLGVPRARGGVGVEQVK